MVGKVQAQHPDVLPNQIHRAWTTMSEVFWKKDQMQLPSAEILLKDYSDDVDVFDIEKIEGVEQLCWGMKKIAQRLCGQIVEVGIDATCEFYNRTISRELMFIFRQYQFPQP